MLRPLIFELVVCKAADEGQGRLLRGPDTFGRSSGCLLELDERGVLAQVKSEQHGVFDLQAHADEVALGLLRLDAAECGELRLALGDFQDGLGTLLADVVAKQTESKGAIMLSRGADGRERSVI